MSFPLYSSPEVYQLFFQEDAQAIASWQRLPLEDPIADVGCGVGGLAYALRKAGKVAFGLERSLPLVRRRAGFIAGCLEALPFRDAALGTLISAHYPYAYAEASALIADRPFHGWSEARRVLRLGGILAAEIPVADRPEALQGFAERLSLGPARYEFFLHDELLRNERGSVLASTIQISTAEGIWRDDTPLMIYRKGETSRWFPMEFERIPYTQNPRFLGQVIVLRARRCNSH